MREVTIQDHPSMPDECQVRSTVQSVVDYFTWEAFVSIARRVISCDTAGGWWSGRWMQKLPSGDAKHALG